MSSHCSSHLADSSAYTPQHDGAHLLRERVDDIFPGKKIVPVMDNLNIHSLASLYEAFEPAEARRIAEYLEIHYTPKHGRWLDLAEIEIGVMARQCLARRIPDREQPCRETGALASEAQS